MKPTLIYYFSLQKHLLLKKSSTWEPLLSPSRSLQPIEVLVCQSEYTFLVFQCDSYLFNLKLILCEDIKVFRIDNSGVYTPMVCLSWGSEKANGCYILVVSSCCRRTLVMVAYVLSEIFLSCDVSKRWQGLDHFIVLLWSLDSAIL